MLARTARLPAAALIALAAAACAWWNVTPSGPLGRLGIADVLYHVHRTCRTMDAFPEVSSVDTFSHHGASYHLHWPPYLTLGYATIAKAVGTSATPEPVVRVLAPVPLVLGLVAVALAAATAAGLGSGWMPALLAATLTGFSAEALSLFSWGALDHHGVTAVLVLGLVASRLRRSLAAWCAVLLAGFATTPEAPMYATVLLVAAFMSERLTTDPPAGRWRTSAWLLAPAATASVALFLNRLPDPMPPSWWSLDLFRLSLFQVALLAVAGGVMVALLPRREPSAAARRLAEAGLAAAAIAAAAVVLVAATGMSDTVLARLGSERLFVTEELSPLTAALEPWQPWARVLLVVFCVQAVFLVRDGWLGSGRERLFGRLVMTAALALGLLEFRHLRSLAPMIAVAVAVTTHEAVVAILARPWFNRNWARYGVVALAVVVLAPPFVTQTLDFRVVASQPSHWAPLMPELTGWLRGHTPPAGSRDEAAAYGVFAPWPLGHHVNVLGERPTVVDPFNHTGVDEPLRAVATAEDDAELAATLTALGARYLILLHAPDMVLEHVPAPQRYRRPLADYPGVTGYAREMQRFAVFRLYRDGPGGARSARFALRFTGSDEVPVVTVDESGSFALREVPRVQVYELDQPGAAVGELDAAATRRSSSARP